MQVDWFTVFAQTINFLVLMWLLKRFLYKPILNAIAAREHHIADQLANASRTQAKAEEEQHDFRQKNTAFDKQKAALLSDANKEAEALRTTLLQKAKAEANAVRHKSKVALDEELHQLMQNTTKRIRQEVFVTTKKLLRDLADVSLEERMIALFIKRMRNLSAEDLATLGASKPSQPVHVSSSFTLPDDAQARITKAINDTLHTDKIAFNVTPELICGIELSVDGQKLAWSASDYLATHEDNVTLELQHAV